MSSIPAPSHPAPAAEAIDWPEVWRGFKAAFPVWFGIAPFGVAAALGSIASGFSPLQVLGMSALVYAGAVQVAAVQLLGAGASWMAVMLATFLIHARMFVPSGAFAPHLRHLSRWYRAVLAFAFVDASYVLSLGRVMEYRRGADFLLGVNISLYVCWNASTLAGLWFQGALGATTAWGLDLVIPLSFLALAVPHLRTRAAVTAAVAGGAAALAIHLWVPGSWHILAGTLAGTAAGAWMEGRPWARGS